MRQDAILKMKEQAKKAFGYSVQEAGDYREPWRIFKIMSEFVDGYQFLSQLKNSVTILGSARLAPTNKYYKVAKELGGLLGKNGFTVITGGGPGIMEAANKGCFEEKGESVGLNIQLPFEQVLNPYVTKFTSFNYFSTRKVMLTSPANAFVYFPGGFGTMDEFFEVVDLIELGLMPKTPIVLVGKDFWQPLIDFLLEKCSKINFAPAEDIKSWKIVDTAEEAYKIVAKTKDCENGACSLSPTAFNSVGNVNWRVFRIMAELVEGFEFLTGITNAITVLGTKKIKTDSNYYQLAYNLAKKAVEKSYAIITGGKQGVAEAANKGAFESGGRSIGIGMKFGKKIDLNAYLTESILFEFPFTRKMIVTAPSKAFVVMPGGFGTMHQMFEILTLMQTKKMAKIPVILFDHEFWQPLHTYIKEVMVHDVETIADKDDELYQMVDTEKHVMQIVGESKN